MKNSWKILFFLVLPPLTGVLGQDAVSSARPAKIRQVGLSIGGGASWVFDGHERPGALLRPTVGLLYRSIRPNRRVAFNSGLFWSPRGDRYEYYTGFNAQTTDTKIIVHYLDVPLTWAFSDYRQRVNSFLKLGLRPGVAIGRTQIRTDQSLYNSAGFRANIDKEVENPFFLGAQIGLGFFSGQHFQFELNFIVNPLSVFPRRSPSGSLTGTVSLLLW